mgnify:CR=1 FL=1
MLIATQRLSGLGQFRSFNIYRSKSRSSKGQGYDSFWRSKLSMFKRNRERLLSAIEILKSR